MPEMRSYYSSHVDAAGYDPETGELHIDWQRGTRTVYVGVPPEVARDVLSAPSIGQALHAHVRGKFDHKTMKDET